MFTQEELDQIEQQLQEQEASLLEQLEASRNSSRPVSLDQEIGRVTRSDAIQQQQMALYSRQKQESKLSQIRGALARIRNGTYGECVLCGEDISKRRLAAMPEVAICVECQKERE